MSVLEACAALSPLAERMLIHACTGTRPVEVRTAAWLAGSTAPNVDLVEAFAELVASGLARVYKSGARWFLEPTRAARCAVLDMPAGEVAS